MCYNCTYDPNLLLIEWLIGRPHASYFDGCYTSDGPLIDHDRHVRSVCENRRATFQYLGTDEFNRRWQ